MQEGLLGDEEGRSASSPRTRRILGLVAVVAVVASVSCTATYFATRRPQGCVCRARRQSGALCFVCGVRAQHAVATRAYTHCSPSFPLYPSLPNHPSLLSRISPTHSFILNLGTRNQQTTPRTHARISVQAGGSPQWTGGSRVRPWHGVRPSLELRGPARVPSSVPFRHPALRTAHRKRPRPRRPEQGYESGLESVKGYYLKHPTPPQT